LSGVTIAGVLGKAVLDATVSEAADIAGTRS
jgi:hypothetical protein